MFVFDSFYFFYRQYSLPSIVNRNGNSIFPSENNEVFLSPFPTLQKPNWLKRTDMWAYTRPTTSRIHRHSASNRCVTIIPSALLFLQHGAAILHDAPLSQLSLTPHISSRFILVIFETAVKQTERRKKDKPTNLRYPFSLWYIASVMKAYTICRHVCLILNFLTTNSFFKMKSIY